MKKIIIFILISFLSQSAFAQQRITLPGVYKPSMIEVNDQYVYITEGMKIKIFSKQDYKLGKSVGQKGEGPGEFKGFIIPYVFPDYLFVNCPTKVLYFTLEGEFIKESRALKVFGRYKPIGDNFVGYSYTLIDGIRYEQVFLYDQDFKKIKELYRRVYIRQNDGSLNLINERPPFFYIYKDRIYLDSIKGDILVFDKSGKEVKTISYQKKPISFTLENKNRFEDSLKNNRDTREYFFRIKKNLKYPKYLPIIKMFHLSGDKLYVLTSKEGEENTNEMLVLDLKGNILARKFVYIGPFERSLFPLHYNVFKGKLYVLIENFEEETWELHISEINQVTGK